MRDNCKKDGNREGKDSEWQSEHEIVEETNAEMGVCCPFWLSVNPLRFTPSSFCAICLTYCSCLFKDIFFLSQENGWKLNLAKHKLSGKPIEVCFHLLNHLSSRELNSLLSICQCYWVNYLLFVYWLQLLSHYVILFLHWSLAHDIRKKV